MWSPKSTTTLKKKTPLDPIMSQINPDHIATCSVLKIHFKYMCNFIHYCVCCEAVQVRTSQKFQILTLYSACNWCPGIANRKPSIDFWVAVDHPVFCPMETGGLSPGVNRLEDQLDRSHLSTEAIMRVAFPLLRVHSLRPPSPTPKKNQ